MTSEDLRSQLERIPFLSLRLHLVSGNAFTIHRAKDAALLQSTLLVLQEHDPRYDDAGYDVIALRNIERIEQVRGLRKDIVQERP